MGCRHKILVAFVFIIIAMHQIITQIIVVLEQKAIGQHSNMMNAMNAT